MLKKVLIANRGEIAVRVIRACQDLNIKTVAVYSTADKDSTHVRLADESCCIGPPVSTESYLNMDNIISAAINYEADAIHPGYGFLAENTIFAEKCKKFNIEFIGPSAASVKLMGDKSSAKATVKAANVPVIPGSEGLVNSLSEMKKLAKQIGFPVIIKATAGGGGKGMRIVKNDEEVERAYNMSKAESSKAFNNDGVYVEKFIENPKHIEAQLLGDKHGNVIFLGERDCSVQRNHQKLIEETPSPSVSGKQRELIKNYALSIATKIGYYSAGTIEFLFDGANIYFMEMNTRLQVEHTVSEELTGIDIVKEMLRVASGETLSVKQEHVEFRGHSIECRINAEDYEAGFRPAPGTVSKLAFPMGPWVRVDTGLYEGYKIPPYYDSMIGKIIVWGDNRNIAIARMQRALNELLIEGVPTTCGLHQKILDNEEFIKGDIDTDFLFKSGILKK